MVYYYDEVTINKSNVQAWAVVRAFCHTRNALRYSE